MLPFLFSAYMAVLSFVTSDQKVALIPQVISLGQTQLEGETVETVLQTPIVPEKPEPSLPSEYVSLDVPLYRQIYTLSCEAASFEMVLAYKGIDKTQDEILGLFGTADPKVPYYENGVMIWGDPDLGFVGNVRGIFSTPDKGLRGATGWGVSNIRVGEVALQLRPKSASYMNFTIDQVVTELKAGNPVIFWHVPDSYASGSVTYQTPSGKSVSFFRDHVAVITGYQTINGETDFLINDPLYGKYLLKESTLIRRMNKREGRVVVVR